MKFIHRIPTAQYAYIEFEDEHDSVEQAMAEHERVTKLYADSDGLTPTQFAKARRDMMITGRVTEEQWSKCNANQRQILHQFDLTLRDITKK